jgi:hypothetical protein
VHVELLPQPSVAVHVTVVFPTQNCEGASFVIVTPLQSSLAVAVPRFIETQQAPLPFAVTAAGQWMVGGVMSLTLIVCTQLDELPQLSVAVHVRLITRLPAQLPFATASMCVMLATPLQSSVAVALPVCPGSVGAEQSTITFAGHVITGACVSLTWIICTQLDELPQVSVDDHVRVMTNAPGQCPAAIESLNVGVDAVPQPSVALAEPV